VLNATIFWQFDLGNNYCEFGDDDVADFACVMPIGLPGKTFKTSYILATNKTIKRSKKLYKCRNLLRINLNTLKHESITKCAQNVHCDKTERWRRH